MWIIWGMIFINRRFGTGQHVLCHVTFEETVFTAEWRSILEENQGRDFRYASLSAAETIWNAGVALNVQK